MNRCKASVGILISLILLCVISLCTLRHQSREYLQIIDQLETAFQSGETEETLAVYQQLESRLESYHNITGLFVNGTELDEIRKTIFELEPLIRQNNNHYFNFPDSDNIRTDFDRLLARLRILIENIYQEELPELWHIL